MAGRIAIDFGTSNTVISCWDKVRQQGIVHTLTDYSRQLQINDEQVNVVPSLIHYGGKGNRFYGNQVIERSVAHSRRTFQWMKRFISVRSPATRRIEDKHISNFEAGEEFLSKIITESMEELEPGFHEEIALTVPVEAFEHYENWLHGIAQRAGFPRVRFIDEPSAAALGYSSRMFAGEACLVFDFGGGSLDVSVVKRDTESHAEDSRCSVLGKAGIEFGGSTIDEWLFEEVASLNGFDSSSPEIQQISRRLLSECESLKEKLSFQDKANLTVMNPLDGSVIAAELTRAQFERLLEDHDAYALIDKTIRRALNDANKHGFDEDNIKAVLMVGGCSQIPSVQNQLRRIFGKDRIKMDKPIGAISRGAASFIAGQELNDYLHHDYAIRHRNAETGQYEYRNLVTKGTPYPSSSALAKLTIRAVRDGQDQLGAAIYEIGSKTVGKYSQAVELVFDESGNVRINTVSSIEQSRRNVFCVNEDNKTFLDADPPANKDEARFEISFSVDDNSHLLITTVDLHNDRILHQDFPLIKLS